MPQRRARGADGVVQAETIPSSSATRVASADSILVTDATGNATSILPRAAITPSPPTTTAPARAVPKVSRAARGSVTWGRRSDVEEAAHRDRGTKGANYHADHHHEDLGRDELVGGERQRRERVDLVMRDERVHAKVGKEHHDDRDDGADEVPCSSSPSSMNGMRMNQLVAPTSFITPIS